MCAVPGAGAGLRAAPVLLSVHHTLHFLEETEVQRDERYVPATSVGDADLETSPGCQGVLCALCGLLQGTLLEEGTE